jgi:hypothetical protein
MATTPGTLLRILRINIGAGAWLAPGLAGRLFGLDVAANPQAPYLARLFGIRDVALALGTSQTTRPSRRVWWRIGIACDLADAAAALIAGRNGTLSKPAAVLCGGAAVMAVGLGAAALAADE